MYYIFVLAISCLLTWILKGISTAPAEGAQILPSVEALSALCDASKIAKVRYYQTLEQNCCQIQRDIQISKDYKDLLCSNMIWTVEV